MVKLYEYYAIYDVSESSNMADFGSLCIPGFKTERGYGYYEYREPEFIKPHKNVILMDKVGASIYNNNIHACCIAVYRKEGCLLDLVQGSSTLGVNMTWMRY